MTLKVFDLQCESGHIFEGWFGSADGYESQQARGLLACPVCGSSKVGKKLSAPRINVGHAREPQAPEKTDKTAVAAPASSQLMQLQGEILRHLRQIVRSTENVGEQFSEEARRMHEGVIEERAIRGTATAQERESLAQDGIVVMPIPDYLDDDRLQ
ncbi:DUF1178 family protein [Paralcaligenes ureilyticus]|jgi:hypothetical protein|uniref:Uncharacterized protein n=1 Tax=Paralcaligenes ureilyticus TaxID=627131 RepID=A0A4R3LXP7_9BURK|nr:DUF1178 family protein [Paralcaligenes ureilyticus]TCT03407.1 hypothetical protein EDC26_11565 [Paralcaligenes ureilyticus]